MNLAYDTTGADAPVTTTVITDALAASPESRLIDERSRYARASGSIVTFRETLTPALAQALLDRNAGNRKLSTGHAESIAAAIKSGEWRETHQAIAVSLDGRLLDGQHRCEAVILAGVSVPVLISFGVSADAFTVIDTGKARRAHDLLSINGADDAHIIAGIARFIYLLENAQPNAAILSVFTGRRGVVSNTAIVATVDREPLIPVAVSMLLGARASFRFVGTGFACGLVCILRAGAPESEVWKFVDKVGSGIGLDDERDPVLLLRQVMTNRSVAKKRVHVHEMAAWTVKAWNLTRTNRRISYIGIKASEDFPAALP